MTRTKLLCVFGTRPEAIKMCPLVKALKTRPEFDVEVCVTAQHRQMLDQVLEVFGVKPDYDLDIMRQAQSLTDITVRALTGLGDVIKRAEPDMVLVHGDTSTTFSAALAAFYERIPVGHVEAGLRSFDKYSPFPEEANRLMTTVLAEVYFAPTPENAKNLRDIGMVKNIFVTGNTVIDSMKYTVRDDYVFEQNVLNGIDFSSRRVITMTAHRRENYGIGLENICMAARELASRDNVLVVYPVHLSPHVQNTAQKYLGGLDNVLLVPPLGVMDMHNLMARSYFVMTDSGGLQEEAPALGRPVLVLRRETERPEAARAGTVKVVGVDRADIVSFASQLLDDERLYKSMAQAVNPYGDGNACGRITDDLLFHFGFASIPAPDWRS